MSTSEPAALATTKPGPLEPTASVATPKATPRPAEPPGTDPPSIDPPHGPDRIGSSPRLTDTPTLGIATLLDIFEGNLTSVSDIFAAALLSIEVDLARIEESVAARDMATVGVAAHRMKGTSGSIRSQRIMAISATVQDAAKRDPRRVDAALLLDLGRAVAEFRKDVEGFRRHLATASAA